MECALGCRARGRPGGALAVRVDELAADMRGYHVMSGRVMVLPPGGFGGRGTPGGVQQAKGLATPRITVSG